MEEIIFIVNDAPEGGFTARALGHSIFTEADTLEQLHDEIKDAVRCHFDGKQTPKIIRRHFVRERSACCMTRLPRDISGQELCKALGKAFGFKFPNYSPKPIGNPCRKFEVFSFLI
jgi:hypothetical protein